MKKILTLIMSIALIGCSENNKQESSENKGSSYALNNYAVVWAWKTKSQDLVDDNILNQSKQLTNLWNEGVIENAYFETEPKADSFEDYPNISFFIKAHSTEEAKEILDELIFVQHDISTYTIHPVGSKWLGRKADVIKRKGITRSWVSVWSTRVDHNSEMSKAEVQENAKEQADAITQFYNSGVVENVYFDIAGTQEQNEITDFVMFVNAETETEARTYLDNLPFVKKNIAHYQLFSVGVHWMGTKN